MRYECTLPIFENVFPILTIRSPNYFLIACHSLVHSYIVRFLLKSVEFSEKSRYIICSSIFPIVIKSHPFFCFVWLFFACFRFGVFSGTIWLVDRIESDVTIPLQPLLIDGTNAWMEVTCNGEVKMQRIEREKDFVSHSPIKLLHCLLARQQHKKALARKPQQTGETSSVDLWYTRHHAS